MSTLGFYGSAHIAPESIFWLAISQSNTLIPHCLAFACYYSLSKRLLNPLSVSLERSISLSPSWIYTIELLELILWICVGAPPFPILFDSILLGNSTALQMEEKIIMPLCHVWRAFFIINGRGWVKCHFSEGKGAFHFGQLLTTAFDL